MGYFNQRQFQKLMMTLRLVESVQQQMVKPLPLFSHIAAGMIYAWESQPIVLIFMLVHDLNSVQFQTLKILTFSKTSKIMVYLIQNRDLRDFHETYRIKVKNLAFHCKMT